MQRDGRPACEGRQQQLVFPERRFTHYYYYPCRTPKSARSLIADCPRVKPQVVRQTSPPAFGNPSVAHLRRFPSCRSCSTSQQPSATCPALQKRGSGGLATQRIYNSVYPPVHASSSSFHMSSSYPRAHRHAGGRHTANATSASLFFAKAENHDHDYHPRTTTTTTTTTSTTNSSPCILPPAT